MIKLFKEQKLLFLILVLASFLRLWNLASFPPHLRNDEAALGYNAFSILKTGKDEHGEFLPVVFQSFGDWKMGGYIYLTIPFIATFGLSDGAVRLPSALLGIISVWLIFKIVNSMFSDKYLALLSSFIFAIAPVFIAFSRGAWEVNAALAFTLAGIMFFQKAMGKKEFLILSAFFFGLTLLTAHSAKLSSPLIVLILIVSYFEKFRKLPLKLIAVSGLVILFFVFPVWLSFTQGKFTRITTLSIFSYYNDFSNLFKAITSRWFNLYSISTLFIRGDTNPQHTAPDIGPFLLVDSIFLIVGSLRVIRTGSRAQNIFIWSSLTSLSLPSALTIEKVNFERILPMFIPLVLLISLGIKTILKQINKHRFVLVLLTFVYLLNYLYFLDAFFIHGSKKNDAWQYGYKQIVEEITPIQANYKKVYVQQSLEQPYIFFLFYGKINPSKYQQIVGRVFTANKEGKDMGLVTSLDNIGFAEINWKEDKPMKNTLYVMPPYKLNEQAKFFSNYKKIREIKDLNGFPRFEIVEI